MIANSLDIEREIIVAVHYGGWQLLRAGAEFRTEIHRGERRVGRNIAVSFSRASGNNGAQRLASNSDRFATRETSAGRPRAFDRQTRFVVMKRNRSCLDSRGSAIPPSRFMLCIDLKKPPRSAGRARARERERAVVPHLGERGRSSQLPFTLGLISAPVGDYVAFVAPGLVAGEKEKWKSIHHAGMIYGVNAFSSASLFEVAAVAAPYTGVNVARCDSASHNPVLRTMQARDREGRERTEHVRAAAFTRMRTHPAGTRISLARFCFHVSSFSTLPGRILGRRRRG